MESALDWHTTRALLEWQVELGVTEAIDETPVDRFAVAQAEAEAKQKAKAAGGPKGRAALQTGPVPEPEIDTIAIARQAADAATSLDALRQAIADFDHCDLKRGARSLVFADGNPNARVLILGEAPGRDEDREGRPFVGRAGQLLDRMLAAIGLDRRADDPDKAAYITNVLPWRPPQNRDPEATEIAMMLPFVQKHIALVDPDVVILMGNIACRAALSKAGILRLRGNWQTAFDKPAMPMTHPAYLLRQPHAKREAWADLLAVQARLRDTT